MKRSHKEFMSGLEKIDSENIKDLRILIRKDWSWDIIGIGEENFLHPIRFGPLTFSPNGNSDGSRFPTPVALGEDTCKKSLAKENIVLFNRDLPQEYQIKYNEIYQLHLRLKELPHIMGFDRSE